MLDKRIEAFEMRCFRRLLWIIWRERITNEEVRNRIIKIIGQYEPLLEIAHRRKLQWFGHITRRPGTLAHTIMHGMVEGRRGRGRPRGSWLNNIASWTRRTMVECVRKTGDRETWREIVNSSKCPNGQRAMGVT